MPYETSYPNASERLPIITNAAHSARALSVVESGDLYFGIGRTTPWENEDEDGFIPPEPDIEAETLDELIGLKKADRVVMVYPDEEGEIEYANSRFRTVTNEEAFELKSRWVLCQTAIYFDEMPPSSYRQIGIFSRVKPLQEYTNSVVLLPNMIENVGILEVLNNRKVITRQSDTRESYFMIIEY